MSTFTQGKCSCLWWTLLLNQLEGVEISQNTYPASSIWTAFNWKEFWCHKYCILQLVYGLQSAGKSRDFMKCIPGNCHMGKNLLERVEISQKTYPGTAVGATSGCIELTFKKTNTLQLVYGQQSAGKSWDFIKCIPGNCHMGTNLLERV